MPWMHIKRCLTKKYWHRLIFITEIPIFGEGGLYVEAGRDSNWNVQTCSLHFTNYAYVSRFVMFMVVVVVAVVVVIVVIVVLGFISDRIQSVVGFISDRIQQWYRHRYGKTLFNYQYSHDTETLLHSTGRHQGSHKAHQADNQTYVIFLPWYASTQHYTKPTIPPDWVLCMFRHRKEGLASDW